MKLRECPFCGNDDPFMPPLGQTSYSGECVCCGALGPDADTPEEAAVRWNTRSTDWRPIETLTKPYPVPIEFYTDDISDIWILDRPTDLPLEPLPTHWRPHVPPEEKP